MKSLDELLSDYVDVSLPSNSDIVNKSVNILKIVAEFITQEKKKLEGAGSFVIEEAKREDARNEDRIGSPRLVAEN